MICSTCGKQIPDNSPSCMYCGQVFSAAPSGYPPTPPPQAPPNYSSPAGPPPPDALFVISPFRSALSALETGKIIRAAMTLLLRIESVLALVLGVYVVIQTLKLGFTLPTPGTIGSILAAILLGGAFFAICQILLYRAASASRLGDSPFTAIPIISILLRATAEIYATLLATAGIAGCVFTWSSGLSPDQLVPFMPPMEIPAENTFLLGLFFMIVSVLGAFGFLILFYFLAEAVIIIADVAKNIRSLVKASGVSQS